MSFDLSHDMPKPCSSTLWEVCPCFAVGVPSDQQRVMFNGTALQDDSTLADCGVSTESTLHVVLRLRGC